MNIKPQLRLANIASFTGGDEDAEIVRHPGPGLSVITEERSLLRAADSHLILGGVFIARLIEQFLADGRALWSETSDRELKDVFAVQSEIATAVTEQLKIKLLGAPAKSDAAPSNDNLAAYNALQQGTFYFALSTEEGTRKATEFFG